MLVCMNSFGSPAAMPPLASTASWLTIDDTIATAAVLRNAALGFCSVTSKVLRRRRRFGDDVVEDVGRTFGQAHRHHAIPRVLHVVGGQVGPVVERDALRESGRCRSDRRRRSGRCRSTEPRSPEPGSDPASREISSSRS